MSKVKKLQLYCIAAAATVAAAAGAAFLYFGVYGEYNPALGYFSSDSVFAPALYICLSAGVAAGIVGWVLFSRSALPDRPLRQNAAVNIAICVIAAAAVAADCIYDIGNTVGNISVKYAYMHYILWMLGAAAAVLMFLCAVPGRSNDPVHSLGFFMMPLFLAAKVLVIYFDRSVAVNSPAKVLFQLSLVCLLLAYTAEAGVSLGRGAIFSRWIFTLCASVSVAGGTGFGALALLIAGVNFPGINICDAAMLSALALYCVCRLFSLADAAIEKRVGRKKKDANAAGAVGSAEEVQPGIKDASDADAANGTGEN